MRLALRCMEVLVGAAAVALRANNEKADPRVSFVGCARDMSPLQFWGETDPAHMRRAKAGGLRNALDRKALEVSRRVCRIKNLAVEEGFLAA